MKLLKKGKFVKENFLKNTVISILIGILCGVVGTVFHKCLEIVTLIRENNSFVILFLPLAGLVIVLMYNFFRSLGNIDLKRVFEAVTLKRDVPVVMMPLILFSTLITHLFGGSAGREGAALQLGGSLGYNTAKLLKSKDDKRFFVTAGMSGVFAAMFGTPFTAAFFSLEVTGMLLSFEGILMGVVSSITSFAVAVFLGVEPVRFVFLGGFEYRIDVFVKIIFLSVLFACVSVVFALTLGGMKKLMRKYISNDFVRVLFGGFAVVILTIVLKTTDYNGAGMGVIEKALSGNVDGIAFLLKILFTAITVSTGFKGGEIVPTFFIGATFGCYAGGFLGLDPAGTACLGFVALFSGMTKCPVAAILLAAEVFGMSSGIVFFLVAVLVAYKLSGKYGLYDSLKNIAV